MIELHGWLTIVATYLDEDKHPEIDEEQIYSDALKAAAQCTLPEKYVSLNCINGTYFLNVACCPNHYAAEVDEIIALFKKISSIASGSYGVIYLLNDEEPEHWNEFQVMVFKRGRCEVVRDNLLSPCIPVLEDGYIFQ